MQGIDYVAWWGAVIATLVLLWDVAKWLKSGPIIRKRVQLDTYYPDSRVLSVTNLEKGESRELASYCHIELVNVGTLPTTIMEISATHTKGKNGVKIGCTNERFMVHYGKTLPYVLPPGEVWSCRFEMTDLHKLSERGKPYIEVFVSHKHKPIVIRLKPVSNKEDS